MSHLIDNDYFNSQMTTLGLKSSFSPLADVLAVLIEEASEWVEAYCRRKFGSQTVTETHWGNSRGRIILGEYPVASIDSITVQNYRGDDITASSYTLAHVRILDGGILELIDNSNVWYADKRYTITYTIKGPVPGPVKRATALKVVDLLDPMYFPGKTKNVELITAVQEQMVTLLEDYRRERLG